MDTDLFTKTLVTSLSPTLDTILKDLFMSTVIPKFEHACCSMFKQIDASFTERSLECKYIYILFKFYVNHLINISRSKRIKVITK